MPSIVNELIMKEVLKEFEASPYAFISSFEALPVADLSDLRRNLEKISKRSLVVKHSIARKAFEALSLYGVEKYFKAHVLVTVAEKDPQNVSKTLVEFAKNNKNFIPTGVIFEKKVYDESFVKALAQLPSRHELLTQMVTRMKSPIAGFVMTLSQVLRGFAVAINEVKKKKEAAGAAS